MPHQPPSAPHSCPAPRYQYDPAAPRHAVLVDRPVGFPAASVGITNSGRFAVVADPSTPPHLVGHALDYADRLAELIPEQLNRRRPTTQRPAPGRHRLPDPPRGWNASRLALILIVMAYAVISCAGPGIGVGIGG